MKTGDTSYKAGVGKTLTKANERTKDMIADAGKASSNAANKIKNKGKRLKDDAKTNADKYLYYDKEEDGKEVSAKDLEKTIAARKAKAAAEAAAAKLAKEKAATKSTDLAEKGNASKDIVVKEPKASTEKINSKPVAKDTPKAYNNTLAAKGKTATAKASDATEFFVIAGSFAIAENAEKAAKDFQKKGYKETEVVSFASTKYKSVCLKRFENRAAADKMMADLKKKNISAYVHKKRFK